MLQFFFFSINIITKPVLLIVSFFARVSHFHKGWELNRQIVKIGGFKQLCAAWFDFRQSLS